MSCTTKPVMLSCRCLGDFTEGVVMFTPFTVCFTLLSSSCTQSVGTKAWEVLLFLSSHSAFYNASPPSSVLKTCLEEKLFLFIYFFASKRYLIHCFPGTVEHWHTGWRAPQTGSYKQPERNDMVLMIENTAPNHSITSTYELWSFRL